MKFKDYLLTQIYFKSLNCKFFVISFSHPQIHKLIHFIPMYDSYRGLYLISIHHMFQRYNNCNIINVISVNIFKKRKKKVEFFVEGLNVELQPLNCFFEFIFPA